MRNILLFLRINLYFFMRSEKPFKDMKDFDSIHIKTL